MKRFHWKQRKITSNKVHHQITLCILTLLLSVSYSYAQKQTKATIYFFISPECPLCISYVPVINEIEEKYRLDNIKCIGIISGKRFEKNVIEHYKKTYQINIPVIEDSSYYWSKQYDAKITPEVVMIDSLNTIVYKGRIDNWPYAPGKKRKKATEHDLKNVLDDYLRGNAINVKYKTAIGCFIE